MYPPVNARQSINQIVDQLGNESNKISGHGVDYGRYVATDGDGRQVFTSFVPQLDTHGPLHALRPGCSSRWVGTLRESAESNRDNLWAVGSCGSVGHGTAQHQSATKAPHGQNEMQQEKTVEGKIRIPTRKWFQPDVYARVLCLCSDYICCSSSFIEFPSVVASIDFTMGTSLRWPQLDSWQINLDPAINLSMLNKSKGNWNICLTWDKTA